jgi:hypothetical protein
MYRLASIPVVLLVMGVHGATRPSAPASIGERTLERMHAAYAGSWYHTLTFRQKTTVYSDTGAPQIQQWYESLAELNGRTLLRIDRGSPADGNGVLYTSDSAYVVRKGVLAVTRPSGNEFLPLIEGVYVQPVTQTADELRRQHFDLTKGYERSWNGMPISVVGAESAADTTSPQFWVDHERNVLVRMVIAFSPTQTFDVLLDHYERAGKGWLATHVDLRSGGRPFQTEDYSDWHVDVALAPALFDVNHWTAAPHWANETTR